jgi:hypothetical protein
MAQTVGPFRRVGDLIAAFVRLGCEVRYTSNVTYLDHTTGQPSDPIRFLHNPKTRGFVPLGDLEDDERIPPSEVENWERRLGVGSVDNGSIQ